MRLDRSASSVARARSAARSYLARNDRRFTEVDSAVLVVSELVSNAVQHATERDDIELIMDVREGCLHVEVLDGDPRPPKEEAPDRLDESGRGLRIVDRLSDRWGWEPVTGNGKRVWCELERSAHWRR
ncbi:MAG TPA: ATP-binding protein [Acidimicrobiaceae bacterium]|nr:ATP-binding protein [Acidimicrobiaceae bacterium]